MKYEVGDIVAIAGYNFRFKIIKTESTCKGLPECLYILKPYIKLNDIDGTPEARKKIHEAVRFVLEHNTLSVTEEYLDMLHPNDIEMELSKCQINTHKLQTDNKFLKVIVE